MEESLLPLFPLELVLLPEEPLPLHIFEERYKLMIGQCLQAKAQKQGQREFGIVLAKGRSLASTGCTASIVNITRKYDDGRMDILTVGKRRFEILLTNEEKPYLQCAVTYFDDEGPDTASEESAVHAIDRFRQVMRRLHHAAEMPIHIPPPYRHLSFRIAAGLPFDPDFKQQLLSLRDETQRLAVVQRAIDVVMVEYDRVQESQKKAGGNGHSLNH